MDAISEGRTMQKVLSHAFRYIVRADLVIEIGARFEAMSTDLDEGE